MDPTPPLTIPKLFGLSGKNALVTGGTRGNLDSTLIEHLSHYRSLVRIGNPVIQASVLRALLLSQEPEPTYVSSRGHPKMVLRRIRKPTMQSLH
jgi:hypothetical protein